ncbi:protein adenylyltransferase Fic [Variovorax sp. OV329]|uniref:protein adenylyltransferase Fic n=1 Tax=Variovorax sp. OV329 TaxID=1882825 RepID=UPI0008EB2D33|nr:Fic family protein [Variovorax sp. OV329]SFM82337.1 Fic family protein [Variovorax sp. OV329]
MSPKHKNSNILPTAWQPQRPYNALPTLPPGVDLESKAILKQCIAARAALAELKQATLLIPNPSVLINTIPLLEAKDSSEIENIVTTTDQLFRYADDGEGQADPATKEALRYRTALYQGFQSLSERPLTTRTAVDICSAIKGVEMEVRRTPGTQLINDRSKQAIYTPPEGESLLRNLLANWERFIHEQPQLDPLVRMAVAHYQFEAIHPFTDGNGRTGRVLNILMLIQERLLTLPVLYLSRYIIHHKADYYRLLAEVTSASAWEEWVIYMLRAVEETAYWTTAKIAALRQLQAQTADHLRRRLPKIYSHELVEVLFEQPYCRIGNLVDKGIGRRQAASRYLQDLVGVGILSEQIAGREKLFIHPKLMQLLKQDDNHVSAYA